MLELNPFNLIIGLLGSIMQPTSSHVDKVQVVKSAVEAVAESAKASEAETYISSSNNNCKIHNPAPQANETVTWSGDCKDGYADGEGITTWYINGNISSTANGNCIKGKLNGSVTMDFKDEGTYTGEMVNNQYQGFGIRTWESGNFYSGQWKNHLNNGYGVMTFVVDENNSIDAFKSLNKGKYIGKNYVVEGIFEDGYLIIECQKSDCPAEYMK